MPSNKPIKIISETTETDENGFEVTYLEVDDDTAERFHREDVELAEQWVADIKTEYTAKLMEATANLARCRRELHEFLAERYDGRQD